MHCLINHLRKLPGALEIFRAALLFLPLFICLRAQADVSPETFVEGSLQRYSPGVEVGFCSISAGHDTLSRDIADLKNSGFGSVFLESITPGSNSWKRIAEVADICASQSMKLGCEFFPQQSLSSNSPSLLFRVTGTNLLISPVVPQTLDYLNKELFERSVNSFLLNAQLSLKNHYGTVLNWVAFPAVNNRDLIWSAAYCSSFQRTTGHDPKRYLPLLAGGESADVPNAKSIRVRWQSGLEKSWRDIFAKNVNTLVQEAGLHAAISIDCSLLSPEESCSYFRVPLLVGTTNRLGRVLNRRAASGAYLYDCRWVAGRVEPGEGDVSSIVDALLIDGAGQIQFSGELRSFKGCSRFACLEDLARYISRCRLILRNTEPVSHFLLCSEDIPQSLDRFAFKTVTLAMLRQAEIANGRLIFPSGRSSSVVVFDRDRSKAATALIPKLRAAGIKVISLEDASKLLPEMDWRLDTDDIDIRFVRSSDTQREFFMIKNESNSAGMVDFSFTMNSFSRVSRWQPVDGRVYEISNSKRVAPSRVSLTTPVRPGELFFIVFDK